MNYDVTDIRYDRTISQSAAIRITAVGDVMLGRSFEASNFHSAESLLDTVVLDLLDGDIVTGNLECLITQSESCNPFSHAHFRASAVFARSLLKRFHVLSLANNHIYDFGDKGIADTISNLEEMGIEFVGIGRTEEESLTPAVISINGQMVAVFGLTTTNNLTAEPSGFEVARPGTAAYKRISASVRAGHIVIVHLHAGGGDVPYPAPEVRNLHKKILDAGAHLILGHHPHCPQGWSTGRRYANFYSLGDFVFDRLQGGRDLSLVVRASITEQVTIDVIPVCRRNDLVLYLPGEDTRSELLDKFDTLNKALACGTSDGVYLDAARSLVDSQLSALFRDFRVGGTRAVYNRVRKAGLHRIISFLRLLYLRLFSIQI